VQNLLVASTNPGKLQELREMMADLPIKWLSLADMGLDQMDVEETGDTFEANALIKARAYCAASGLPTLADDSGIVVDALNGEPGIHSARYAPTSEERNVKLLQMLEGVPDERRTARFVCVVALVTPDQITVTAEGRVEGHVGTEPRGTNGFGYDPIFVLDNGLTTAELAPAEKNAISHRGRALAQIHPILRCLFGSP
jgi:XTP/dITP diphosphohydrolase